MIAQSLLSRPALPNTTITTPYSSSNTIHNHVRVRAYTNTHKTHTVFAVFFPYRSWQLSRLLHAIVFSFSKHQSQAHHTICPTLFLLPCPNAVPMQELAAARAAANDARRTCIEVREGHFSAWAVDGIFQRLRKRWIIQVGLVSPIWRFDLCACPRYTSASQLPPFCCAWWYAVQKKHKHTSTGVHNCTS